MSDRRETRLPNGAGGVDKYSLTTGQVRYRVRLNGRCIGLFDTRKEAEEALAVAKGKVAS